MKKGKTQLLHEVRAVKTKEELSNIILAQRISERVLQDALGFLRTGITEIQVAEFIKESFIKYNAPVLAFDPIVAFGKGSFDIHHEPGKSKLKKGDIIMLDFGTTVKHYCSDMTRTYFWGEPTAKQKKVYLDVLEAMDRAMKKVAGGERRCKVIDKSARDFLDKKYKIKLPKSAKKGSQPDGFTHGLGHGVGTVIHEWPGFHRRTTDIMPVGCVMTVEPGIYLRGWGGIRIEDMILITPDGYRNLINVPKDLKSAVLEVK